MKLDPVLAEIRGIRETYAEQFHGDVHAMMEDLRRRHAESKRQSVTRAREVSNCDSTTSREQKGATSTTFGTTDDYYRALHAVLSGNVPSKHRAMLEEHFKAPKHTATWKQLAEKVGYPNFNTVNLQYGRFGEQVARQLGLSEKPLDPNGYAWWLWTLVDWADEPEETGDTAFVLRPEVVRALERFGYGESPSQSRK